MLTKLKSAYEKLIHSKEFKHEGFLCGAFLIADIKDLENTDWQIDFYNKETDTITTYLVGLKIEVTDNSKVFKNEKVAIEELKVEDIKVNFNELKDKLDKILKEKQEDPVKITIILQNQNIPVWNIIYITQKFNLLNVKIDAVTGIVLDEKVVPLLSFEKGDLKR